MVRESNAGSASNGATQWARPTGGGRTDRRGRRAEARRLEIVRAAARTFRRRGFAAAGMREIAEEADLSPGNLYHYFKGKEEILYFCQDRSLDVMIGAIETARLSGEPADVQLGRVVEAHVRCLLDELEGSSAHLEIDALPPPLRQKIVAKRDRYERSIRRLIARGVRRGEFVLCDARLVTRAILGALNWTARWFNPAGAQSARAVGRDLAAFLVRGLATGTDRSRTGGIVRPSGKGGSPADGARHREGEGTIGRRAAGHERKRSAR